MTKLPEDLVEKEVLPMLFSRRVPELTYYRNPAEVQKDQNLSVLSRGFILHLLKSGVSAVVVIPREDLDATVDRKRPRPVPASSLDPRAPVYLAKDFKRLS